MSNPTSQESLYLREQRRFRRLEASLPVWLANADEFDAAGAKPWSLGYTRDISMGGSKVFVPTGDEAKWRAAMERKVQSLLRYDVPGVTDEEYVTGYVRHVARDQQTGNLWLGVEFDDGAERTRSEVMKAGLKSVHQRRRLQVIVCASLVLLVLGGIALKRVLGENSRLNAQINQGNKRLALLNAPRMVGTRAEGISALFESQALKQSIDKLRNNISDLNDPKKQAEAERAREAELRDLGLANLKPIKGAQVTFGVAWPYGFAWPQTTGDLEQLLGRRIPGVVSFRDFKAAFPDLDCREARLRGKTLQITWEPWQFSDPNAVKLEDIVAGKWDKYIDSWANGARAFGGEMQIRFGHEFNGNWYPWSIPALKKRGKGSDLYVKAYQHVHDRFVKAGAFNVRWVWCYNAESVPDQPWNSPIKGYPGDAFVDMVSIDGYNFGTALPNSRWQTFKDIYWRPYKIALKNFTRKPLVIGEIGCASVGGDKVGWMKDMDKQLRGDFRRFSGLMWFEAAKEADWRMVSSPETLGAARAILNQDHYRRGEQ